MVKTTPSTRNAQAAALIQAAEAKCEGCRLSWRIDKRRGNGWRHREPMPIECTAKYERQALRDIAAKRKPVPIQAISDGGFQ